MHPKIQDGIKLRQLREKNNLTQTQAGSLIDLSQSEYNKIENEEHGISIQNLTVLAKAYKTEIQQLLKNESGLNIYNSSFHDQSIAAQTYNNMKEIAELISTPYKETIKAKDEALAAKDALIQALKKGN